MTTGPTSPTRHLARPLPALTLSLTLLATAAAQAQAPAHATASNDPLPAITVTAPEAAAVQAAQAVELPGVGSAPAWQLPMQVRQFGHGEMQERGVQRLADLVHTEASLSHAYNAEGYWD